MRIDDAPADTSWPVVPVTGVTELRVHGVGGTPAAGMLDDPAPVQVAGDHTSGFWRRPGDVRADPGLRVEAYSWGGLTGRAAAAALWLLVLPFALCNVAGWMAPARPEGGERHLVVYRACSRVAALAMTCLYVAFACSAFIDVATYQCPALDGCALAGWPLVGAGGAAHAVGRRVVVGAAGPVLLLVVLYVLTQVSRRRYEKWDAGGPAAALGRAAVKAEPDAEPAPAAGSTTAAGTTATGDAAVVGERSRREPDSETTHGLALTGFWDGNACSHALVDAHLAAGLAVVSTVVASTVAVETASGDSAYVLLLGAALLAAGCVAAAASTAMRVRLRGFALTLVSAVLLLASCWMAWGATDLDRRVTRPHPGLVIVFDVVLGLVEVPATIMLVVGLGRRGSGSERVRRALVPFAVLVGATLITGTVLAGAVMFLGTRLDAAAPVLYPLPYERFAQLAVYAPGVVASCSIVAVGLVAGPWSQPWRQARDDTHAAWRELPTPGPAWESTMHRKGGSARLRFALALPPVSLRVIEWTGTGTAVTATALGLWFGIYWLAGGLGRCALTLVLVALATVVTGCLVPWRRSGCALRRGGPVIAAFAAAVAGAVALRTSRPDWHHYLPWQPWLPEPPLGLSVTALAFTPVVAWLILRRAIARPTMRRHVGIAWDIATFWPRAFHPLAPPSYGERAVPELRRRLLRIAQSGGGVVLLAHSQGSVLAAAALTGLTDDEREVLRGHVRLVTYGSPLTRLYGCYFPAYVDRTLCDDLVRLLTDDAGQVHWTNFFRDTDVVGHRVFPVAAGAGGERPDPGVDRWLVDPATCFYAPGDERPRVRGHAHAGYRYQSDFAALVEAELAALAVRPWHALPPQTGVPLTPHQRESASGLVAEPPRRPAAG
jgi:hypothetical protein